MHRLSILVAVVIILFSSIAHAEVSDGWRMGMIVDAKTSGWFNKSQEGQLSMGVDGTPMVLIENTKDSKGNTITNKNVVNPWKFTYKGKDNLSQYTGQYVVVKYEKVLIRNPLAADTPYDVTAISPLTTTPLSASSSATDTSQRISKADGSLVGRIVQASYHGLAIKTYELTVQVGAGGGQYKFMSCTDKDVYDYAIEVLKRGKMVKITYEKLGIMTIGSFTNTDYRVIQIDTIVAPQ